MHLGKSYKTYEFLLWSRRNLYVSVPLSMVSVTLYAALGWTWLSIPWSVVLLLGTTVALISGFKNTQTYNRSAEAQQVWSSIVTSSRIWAVLCRDFLGGDDARKLVHRHIAWLTSMRFAMRGPRPWETVDQKSNAEFRKNYRVPEWEGSLEAALATSIACDEAAVILNTTNHAARVLHMQSGDVKRLMDAGALPPPAFLELQKTLRELHDQQSRSERIKNFPYPRQYAVVSALFVRIFCLLLPFGMVSQFAQLNDLVAAPMKGHMAWLTIPFSAVIGWMYTSLDQVGESTSNPFEGSANDVPISQISAMIEIELRELLGERDVPALAPPINGIAL